MLKNILLVLSVLLLMAGTAFAGTASSTLTVTGSVDPNCTISAGAMAFGAYNGVANVEATADITLTCTNTTGWSLGLDGIRTLSSASTGGALGFQIYKESTHTNVFGATGSADVVSGSGTGSAQVTTAYGLIEAGPMPAPATDYKVLLTAMVTF